MTILNVASTLAAIAIGSSPLQAQVDATPLGGTLQLEAESYIGELVLERAITIRGKGAAETILQGAEGTVVTVRGSKGGEVVLEGLTIKGGGKPTKLERITREGGGLHIEKGAKVQLLEVVIRDNHAVSGAGIWLQGELRGKNVTIEGNRGNDGSALRAFSDGIVELENALIRDNGPTGAQVQFFGKVLVLRRVVLKEARPSGPAKGVHLSLFGLRPDPPMVLLEQVTFGASSGSPVLVEGGDHGAPIPTVTLIDTPWPADAQVPQGWAPIVQEAQVVERSTR